MSKWTRKAAHDGERFKGANEPSGHDSESEDDESCEPVRLSARICLWEFGQNDPKRYLRHDT